MLCVTWNRFSFVLILLLSFIPSWLNTTMTENRKVLTNNDLDGFDKVHPLLILHFYFKMYALCWQNTEPWELIVGGLHV